MSKQIKFLFHLLLCCYLSSNVLLGQTTTIPDVNFEQALVNQGIDSDGLVNGLILNSDASAITFLDVSNSTISDLTGIQAFTALTTLDCDYNQLTALNISSNTALTTLQCNSNQLTALNLSSNTALTTLQCNSNQFTNLSISSNAALTTLHCNNNQLATLNLSSNTALTTLHCNSNLFTSLNISSNTALTTLICAHNQLTALDVSNNTALEYLFCINNQLTALNLSSNTALESLNFETNQLTTINLSSNAALESLTCQNNPLTALNLANNTALTYLRCSNNPFTTLDLSNNTALVTLFCINNQLTALNLSNNTALATLNCTNNQLTGLNLANNPVLAYLYCNNNQLITLNLNNNLNLQFLHCHYNQLTTLNLANNPALFHLQSQDNQLTNLNLLNNLNLEFLRCDNNQLTALELTNNIFLQNLSCYSNQLQYLSLKNKPNLAITGGSYVNLYNNLPNLLICVDDATIASNSPLWSKDSTATYSEVCPNTTLVGHVKSDINNNCVIENTDPVIENAILSITDGSNTIYRKSNTSGHYTGELDTGNYTINLIPPNPYFNACVNPQTMTVDSINDRDTVNWALQTTHSCPFMVANLSAPFLRATGGGSNYTINYCNQGTAPTYDAYIEVTIDSLLTVLGTSLPIASQVGNIYTFDLDTVNIGECGSFTIHVIADTSLPLGQVLCSEAHIYPDSLCNNVWNGPIIQASGICQTDTVFFELKNIGDNMISPLNYIVIEDNIIMRTDPFILGNNASQTVAIRTQPGKTYRIEAEQAPNFPAVLGPHIAHTNVIGCQGGGIPNVGTTLNYYNGNPAPWIDIDCQAAVSAYDPNDKTPQPIGYSAQHYITNETPITYKVRFQNTGNDTAFNVVVLDTFSAHLDIATLQMKSASDDYTWSLTSGNALRVNFTNIKLVDSITNEPLSHGFFTYEISPKPNLTLGAIIENTAAIYFDYNPPIFTNTTWHTIGEDFVPSIILTVENIYQDQLQVKAFPNPFTKSTSIEVSGKTYNLLELEVYDLLGRKMASRQVSFSNQVQLERGNLQTGIYVYRLIGDQQIISTGKITVD